MKHIWLFHYSENVELFYRKITDGRDIQTDTDKKQLDEGRIPQNHVLLEMTYTTEGIKSKGGIIIGINRSEEYEDETVTHAADLTEIWAIVYKLPEKLYFDKTDPRSMSWECDMDLEIGDTVWFNTIESANAIEIECENKTYKLIPYSDIYCAKRNRWLEMEHFWTENNEHKARVIKDIYNIVMLNGYCLLKPIFTKSDSPLAIDKETEDKGWRNCSLCRQA